MATLSNLTKQTFIVKSHEEVDGCLSASSSYRFNKRIYLSIDVLKASKICAGDLLMVKAALKTDDIRKLTTSEQTDSSSSSLLAFAIGVAWPSANLEKEMIVLSMDHIMTTSVVPGDLVSVIPLPPILPVDHRGPGKGIKLPEAKSITLTELEPNLNSQRYSNNSEAQLRPGLRPDGQLRVGRMWKGFTREVLVDRKYLAINHHVSIPDNLGSRILRVDDIKQAISSLPNSNTKQPLELFVITRNTEITINPPVPSNDKKSVIPPTESDSSQPCPGDQQVHLQTSDEVGYDAVGGLDAQVEQIRDLVELPLTRPELYSHFGLAPPRGILLYGPPGTGKTLLASIVAKSTGSSFLTLSSSSIGSAYHGESEQKIYDLFAEAKAKSPCLILIDEIDGLFPNRDSGGEVERRLVGALLTCMDGIEDKVANIQSHQEISSETPSVPMHATSPPRVMVIATTNRPNAIDPALRRPGRFDRELEIGIPDASARFKILQVLLRKVPHQLTVDQIKLYADRTHGYVGADLVSLIRTAGLGAIKRSIQSQPTPPLKEMKLEADDVEKALLTTRPSAMREVFIETPKVKWADVGGQHIVKQKLRECVEWPMRYSQTFKTLGIRPTRGVLLYGPPGCSKTLIAKALASESGLNFISLKGSEIFHKYVGESEKSIRDLFRKARAASPSVVFLDEIDTIAASRSSEESGGSGTQDRVLTSLLTEMDGIEELNGVLVLAATNRPDVIDSALMRPGRLDRILYVGPPDFESRKEILKINFGKMSISNEVKIDRLAEMTDGCTGAEIVSMCQDAALVTMNKDLDATQVSEEDLLEAAHQIRRRITPETIKMYEDWRDRSGVRSA